MTQWQRPNYETARAEAGFRWFVGSSQGALRTLTGTPIREFNLDPEACIEAYRKGRPLIREIFGPEVQLPPLSTPSISYGHVNGLGSQLTFPEGGEVGHSHIYDSLDEAIAALQRPVDFATAGMAPFYIEFHEKMQAAFPGEKVGFAYSLEGPITTAWEMRGEGFFLDIYDEPEKTEHFLRLATDSIIDFHRFRSRVNGTPAVNPAGGGMVDDLASMIPPQLWPRFVLPYWEQYYRGITSGPRSAHVEDLRPPQLPYLEDIGLRRYDPSISHKLNPQLIFAHCRVPFGWRLGSFHYSGLSHREVQDFVYQSVADGASEVFTYVAADMCREPAIGKVQSFIEAAQETERMLQAGATREEVGEMVSPRGRDKFWEHWLE